MKKKLPGLLLGSLLLFTLTACNSNAADEGSSTSDGKPDSGSAEDLLDSTDIDAEVEELDTTTLNTYHLDSDGSTIIAELISYETTEKFDAAKVLEQLAQYDVITEGITFRSMDETTDNNGDYILTLDLSASFAEYLDTLDAETETLVMKCITNTFIDYYNASRFLVTVDGEELATKHHTYAEPLTFTDIDINNIRDGGAADSTGTSDAEEDSDE